VPPSEARTSNGVLPAKREMTYASYDEIYPPGPGKAVIETTCMQCHGENFFPGSPRSAQGWKFGLDRMMGKNLPEHDRTSLGEGVLSGSASSFRFGPQDRKDVIDYLTKNFGPDKKPRGVKTDKEMPIDEAALGKAQYMEYYTVSTEKEAAPSKTVAATDSENAAEGVAGVRIIMQVSIDAEGNQWGVDRGVPSRLIKLDPRTGEQKVWELPDKRAGVHDMTQDRQGEIWVLEFARIEDGHVDGSGAGSVGLHSRLLGFNPKAEKWDHVVDLDPDNVIRAERKGPLMGGLVDSKGKIWVHWMLTGAISSYDPATKKVATYRIPTPNATPYGAAIDPFDNIWEAEWNGGKLARFDQTTGAWTEFISPIYPANFRRGPESDAEGNIWVGIWAAGNRPGKVAKLDPKTGRWQMWDIPHRGAQPYETSIDRDGNIWFPDTYQSDRPMANVRFNPKDGTFIFYPRPQFVADSTRVMHAEDGSVHYTARYGAAKDQSGFGVLFPDKDKITTLAPKMLNGAPGYPFKVGASKSTQ
jgi:streptogramin lyase/mono/diheme cytochrome c family protein